MPMSNDTSKTDKGYIFRVMLAPDEGGDRWKVAIRNKDLSSGKDFFEALCDGRTSLSLFLSNSKYHLLVELAKALVQEYADPARRERRKEYLVAEHLGLVAVCDGANRRFVHVLYSTNGAVLVLDEDGAVSEMPVILRLSLSPRDIGIVCAFDPDHPTDLLRFVNDLRTLFTTNEAQVLLAVGWMTFALNSEAEKPFGWELKALLSLVGEPSTGKTTLAEVLLAMVGASASCRDYTPSSLLARMEASSIPACHNDYRLSEIELEKLKNVVVSIAEGVPRDSQRNKVYPRGSVILTSNSSASALQFDKQSGIMTRSVVLPINRPTEAEVAQFAQKKAALTEALGRSCLYAELIALRYRFRHGGEADKVKQRVSAQFQGLFEGTWSRLWAVYEPTLCFTYYVLRQLGEKKLMKKVVLPFMKAYVIPMLRPPTIAELLKKVEVQLLALPKEQRIVEARHFLKLTTKLAAVKNQEVLLIAHLRADLFLAQCTGKDNSFQDLVKHNKTDVHVADSRQHFPKEKVAALLPRTRAAGHMYQLVPAMFEIAEGVDGDLITLVKEAWSLDVDRTEGGTSPIIAETPRARLANTLSTIRLNAERPTENDEDESGSIATARVEDTVQADDQHEVVSATPTSSIAGARAEEAAQADEQHNVVSATPKRQYRKKEVKVTKVYSLRKRC
uniref:SF3 helicase domain-containing protein n=1 Tax=Plectus sambesii TaxID=2011161 RepID=A0A914W6E2_9BILA